IKRPDRRQGSVGSTFPTLDDRRRRRDGGAATMPRTAVVVSLLDGNPICSNKPQVPLPFPSSDQGRPADGLKRGGELLLSAAIVNRDRRPPAGRAAAAPGAAAGCDLLYRAPCRTRPGDTRLCRVGPGGPASGRVLPGSGDRRRLPAACDHPPLGGSDPCPV